MRRLLSGKTFLSLRHHRWAISLHNVSETRCIFAEDVILFYMAGRGESEGGRNEGDEGSHGDACACLTRCCPGTSPNVFTFVCVPQKKKGHLHLTLFGADCKAWADVVGPDNQYVGDGIHKLRSHAEIEGDVREVLERLKKITRVTFVHVDYLGGKVQVRCGIELDENLRVWQAVNIARDAKTEIEVNVTDVSCSIHAISATLMIPRDAMWSTRTKCNVAKTQNNRRYRCHRSMFRSISTSSAGGIVV